MTAPLAPIRFAPERALIDQLFDRFGLDILIEHFVDSGGARSAYEAVLGSQLRLTPLLAPRLSAIVEEVRAKLAFDEPLELFVGQDASVNAGAMHRIGPDESHVLSLTSALVERMSDAELRFVVGHEVGHLAWRHYQSRLAAAAFGEDDIGRSKAPPLLLRRLESWDRMAEISADRAGFLVIDGDLSVAVSAFFKIQSGLGPEHLRFDIQAFLDQLETLQRLERRELLAQFSHPATPIRVRALQLFGEALARGEPVASVDHEVETLARLMDYSPSEPLDVNAREFLLAGGMLVANADFEAMADSEWQALVELLLPLSADPEREVGRIESREHAEEILERSAAWLRDNAGSERYELLRGLAHVAAADGKLSVPERELLRHVAEKLDIPARAADQIAFETLADRLQTQLGRGMVVPHLASRPHPPARTSEPPSAPPKH
ncbi:MAG: M48 family metalloprotease [Deltaproteobacteria bacterium]|nr:M48 family metalloprotease [Deltaproteobacteria bacterium]